MKKPCKPESAGCRSARLRRGVRNSRFLKERCQRRRRLHYAQLFEARRPDGTAQDAASRRVRIPLPATLSLETNYDATIGAINRLQSYVLADKIHVLLDFRPVIEVELAAVLVLTAEIDRCRRLKGQKAVNGTYPESRGVYDQLRTVGFFKLLNIASMVGDVPPPVNGAELRVLPFVTGDNVDGGVINGFLTDLLADVCGVSAQARRDLYGCLIEAIKNATEHANKSPAHREAIPKRWWMAGSARPSKGECAIVVFDQGAGIPKTLPPNARERVQALVARVSLSSSDSLLIRAATRLGRSSTGEQGRGKGFETMKKFVARSSPGELVVHSLRGRYRYASNANAMSDGRTSLGGTLVQWRMQHTAETHRVAS